MLVGDTRDLSPSLTGLSTTGVLRAEGPDTVDRWIDGALAAGLIAVSGDQYRTLSLTARGRDVMRGRGGGLEISAPPRSWTLPRRDSHRARGRSGRGFESFLDD